MKLPQIKQHKSLTEIGGRTFVVGDLHGSYDELMTFLDEWGFDKKTERVIGVGDLIDRGNKNSECLELLNEPWFESALGNHEYMLYDIVKKECRESLEYWITRNGGDWVVSDFGFTHKDFIGKEKKKETLTKLINKLKPLAELIANKMSLSIDFKTQKGLLVGVCHAGVPGYDWEKMINYDVNNLDKENSPIWTRKQLTDGLSYVNGVYEVCHGHTPVKDIGKLGNRNYLDTGLYASKKVGFKIY